MNQEEIHIVPKLSKPIRLQDYGVGIFNLIPTKSALKKALKKNLLTVNNIPATSATFIKGEEIIKLNIPVKKTFKTKLKLKLDVIYEDEYLAIIKKPAGILVSGNSFKTITNALPQNLKPSQLKDATLPQPVHRLDYPTSGLLLVGKTNTSIRFLNKLFETKTIEKTYYAITIGNMQTQGIIKTPIENKISITHYLVENSVDSKRFEKLNLVKLQPKTGRKHQLRIHLSSLKNPILGDREYGIPSLILKGKGLYLHAYKLKFTHPFSKKIIEIEDELPKKFKKIFETKQ
ncbi:RluA family pseudouridine synthase [Lacinutrix sp. 5H-3-7-4]|uniref:RluA family pseudouridine synthase n=1 Tax=Lacinutrix sp. (strain 5H-3-7-4) TaxID=983544 RepID=UPI00020A389A|nr:RluA family pseudouridine synthase [Lacinutrix sp. 5H-3-7-4]AEH00411.1 pseudouridine synthase, RluA family [Lacinutrix sp. 5H-3-7-4]